MAKLDLGYKTVELYLPGAMVELNAIDPGTGQNHRNWEILRVSVIWDQYDEPRQMLTLSPVDDEGDNLHDLTIEVNSDMHDIVEL